jgi:hypothetical protein
MNLCDSLGRARALKAINSWYISPKHALTINRHILISHFGHLASLVWAKMVLGRFLHAVLPDFSRFPAGSLLVLRITLTRFSLMPAMGDIAVEMSQGHRICVRVFYLQYS